MFLYRNTIMLFAEKVLKYAGILLQTGDCSKFKNEEINGRKHGIRQADVIWINQAGSGNLSLFVSKRRDDRI